MLPVKRETFQQWGEAVLPILRRDGFARVPWSLHFSQALALHTYFKRTKVYSAHVKQKAVEKGIAPETFEAVHGHGRWPMFCHDMADVVHAPYLWEIAVGFHDLVAAYFEEQPRLYSMNAFWTQPSAGAPYQDTHGWHRDEDDRKQLVMFMYLSDVTRPSMGAHLYQRGTHLIPDNALGYDFRSPPANVVETITGGPGSVFLADTRGLHQGMRPEHYPRGLAWARWGVSNPPVSYGPPPYDNLSPVELKPEQRAILNSHQLRDAVQLVGF